MKIYTKIIIDISSGDTLYEESYEYEGDIAKCGGGGGGGGDQETTIRYAPYIESKHQAFLEAMASYRAATTDDSPFTGYTDIVIESAFFGTGYTIASFPSMYDMYGKFMAGLDVDTLYSQIFEDTVNAPEINNLVSAEADLLDDDIETNSLPRLQLGMRDINSVMASTFVIGKSIIEDAREKSLSKFSAELKYRMLPVVADRWKTHLEWNKSVIMTYAEIMKLYYSAKMDVTDFNYTMDAKDKLWPFTVLDYERAALGALQGATKTTSDVAGASTASKAISGALSGAAAGAMVGSAVPGIGTGIGAVVGGVLGLAGSLF